MTVVTTSHSSSQIGRVTVYAYGILTVRSMGKKYKIALMILLVLGVIGAAGWYLHGNSIAVLDPKGPVAHAQRSLIIVVTLLMLIVVVPVFVLTFVISWRYRASNTTAKYTPDADGNRLLETTWWVIPSVLILGISIITWHSSHQLDPNKVISSSTPPMTIQVVALQWKWLFIYPEQHIATVNFVEFPKATPVNFQITADAPMNSFWIPQLGGQIYAMTGMSTNLNLMASNTGDFRGSSANLSGNGFANMEFMARAATIPNFKAWVNSAKQNPGTLDQAAYNKLLQPSTLSRPQIYSSEQTNLYHKIVLKYMPYSDHLPGMEAMSMGGTNT